jgi:hypothetical protein
MQLLNRGEERASSVHCLHSSKNPKNPALEYICKAGALFADTFISWALLNREDAAHNKARTGSQQLFLAAVTAQVMSGLWFKRASEIRRS